MVPRPLRYGNGSRKSRPVTRKHGNGAQPYFSPPKKFEEYTLNLQKDLKLISKLLEETRYLNESRLPSSPKARQHRPRLGICPGSGTPSAFR